MVRGEKQTSIDRDNLQCFLIYIPFNSFDLVADKVLSNGLAVVAIVKSIICNFRVDCEYSLCLFMKSDLKIKMADGNACHSSWVLQVQSTAIVDTV